MEGDCSSGVSAWARFDTEPGSAQVFRHSWVTVLVRYHFSNEGVCSWYDFAKNIFEIQNIDIKVNPLHTYEFLTLAERPKYSVLDKTKIKSLAIEVPYWRDSLKTCLKELNK